MEKFARLCKLLKKWLMSIISIFCLHYTGFTDKDTGTHTIENHCRFSCKKHKHHFWDN
jgi:hypothetical protein